MTNKLSGRKGLVTAILVGTTMLSAPVQAAGWIDMVKTGAGVAVKAVKTGAGVAWTVIKTGTGAVFTIAKTGTKVVFKAINTGTGVVLILGGPTFATCAYKAEEIIELWKSHELTFVYSDYPEGTLGKIEDINRIAKTLKSVATTFQAPAIVLGCAATFAGNLLLVNRLVKNKVCIINNNNISDNDDQKQK